MFFIDEEEIEVNRLMKDTGFSPRYDEYTGEIYKYTQDNTIEFVKVRDKKIWELHYLKGQEQEDIFLLFLVFKVFDGILQWGIFHEGHEGHEDGKRDILKQDTLILRNIDSYIKNKRKED